MHTTKYGAFMTLKLVRKIHDTFQLMHIRTTKYKTSLRLLLVRSFLSLAPTNLFALYPLNFSTYVSSGKLVAEDLG